MGVFFYADGSQYEGQWFRNLKDGFAIFTKDNGDREAAIYSKDRVFRKLDQALVDSVLFHSELRGQEGSLLEDLSVTDSVVRDSGADESRALHTQDSQNALLHTFGPGQDKKHKKALVRKGTLSQLQLMPNFYYSYVDFSDFLGVLDPTTQLLVTKNVLSCSHSCTSACCATTAR